MPDPYLLVGELAGRLQSILSHLRVILRDGRVPISCGNCGTPYGNCDMECVAVAYINHDINEALKVLRKVEQAR